MILDALISLRFGLRACGEKFIGRDCNSIKHPNKNNIKTVKYHIAFYRSRTCLYVFNCFITNNTAKIQLKMFGRAFRLTSGAIVNAKKLTLCWVLSYDAKKRETETEPGEVLVGYVLNRWSGKNVESKLRSGLSC